MFSSRVIIQTNLLLKIKIYYLFASSFKNSFIDANVGCNNYVYVCTIPLDFSLHYARGNTKSMFNILMSYEMRVFCVRVLVN